MCFLFCFGGLDGENHEFTFEAFEFEMPLRHSERAIGHIGSEDKFVLEQNNASIYILVVIGATQAQVTLHSGNVSSWKREVSKTYFLRNYSIYYWVEENEPAEDMGK